MESVSVDFQGLTSSVCEIVYFQLSGTSWLIALTGAEEAIATTGRLTEWLRYGLRFAYPRHFFLSLYPNGSP